MQCQARPGPSGHGFPLGFRRSRRLRIVALACAVLLAGCATLSPQIYSDDLLLDASRNSETLSYADARKDAEQAIRRYIAAVQELSSFNPRVGAALILSSAVAVIKGVTNPSGSALAKVAVGGSAGVAYGSTLVSKQREEIYMAGASALNCVIAASEPFNVAASTSGTWDASQQSMNARLAELQELLRVHAGAIRDTALAAAPARAQPQSCKAEPAPNCNLKPESLTAMTTEERSRLTTSCLAAKATRDQECAVPGKKTTTVLTADPVLQRTVGRADVAVADALALDARVKALRTRIAGAASDLRFRSREIQFNVGREVSKTVPDIASFLAASEKIKTTALAIGGQDALKPVPSVAQSGSIGGKSRARPFDAKARNLEREIAKATEYLAAATMDLSKLVGPILLEVDKPKATCKLQVPGRTLTLVPDLEEIEVPAGSQQTFYVMGAGEGLAWFATSRGGGKPGTIKPGDESGKRSFIYTAPAEGAAPQGDQILFTDPAGPSRTVNVKIVAPLQSARVPAVKS